MAECWLHSPSLPAWPSPAQSPPPSTGLSGTVWDPLLAGWAAPSPPAQCAVGQHHPLAWRRAGRGAGLCTGPAGRAPGRRGRAPTAAPAPAVPEGSLGPAAAPPAEPAAALWGRHAELGQLWSPSLAPVWLQRFPVAAAQHSSSLLTHAELTGLRAPPASLLAQPRAVTAPPQLQHQLPVSGRGLAEGSLGCGTRSHCPPPTARIPSAWCHYTP